VLEPTTNGSKRNTMMSLNVVASIRARRDIVPAEMAIVAAGGEKIGAVRAARSETDRLRLQMNFGVLRRTLDLDDRNWHLIFGAMKKCICGGRLYRQH